MLKKCFLFSGLILVMLAGCNPAAAPVATPEIPTPLPVDPPTPVPTEVPARSMVICLGQEPDTLYLYGGSSNAMWSVLEAVYDGPVDMRQYTPQPVILEKIPSLESGDAVLEGVDVKTGQIVVDASGELVSLQNGVLVHPSGCSSADCAAAWDENAPFQMDRLVIQFALLPGLTWSDGAPLSADDSIYSYSLASDPATPVSRSVLDRTESYQALDAQNLQWIGKPGYFPAQFSSVFWTPLPRHAWAGISAAELLQNDLSRRTPLGWGPYIIKEWVVGDHITLERNPNYFRAAEGLPHFDELVYRFLSGPSDGNLSAVINGECDIVDRTGGLDEQLQLARETELSGKLKLHTVQGPEWEQVVFGINPASYDANSGVDLFNRRANFFGDARTRQAFAYCMDRPRIIADLLFNQSAIPAQYLPANHPLYDQSIQALPYNVEEGARLLDEVGWKDYDNDPSTPRQAVGVPGVVDGTPLVVRYATTQALLRQEVAELLRSSLPLCGIELQIESLNPAELYLPGPNGAVFGRQFDLVQLAWKASLEPPCSLYLSSRIPSAANQWIGVNVAGYSSAEYDAACNAARQTHNMQPGYIQFHQSAMKIFAADLPAIPLYYRVQASATRPDLCGMEMDISTRSDLWNLENLDYGESCSNP